MRPLLYLTSIFVLLLGLPEKGLAQYLDGPIDLRMWVSQSYVSQTGSDGPGEPAEHRWDWEFEDNYTGKLGSIPGCIEYSSSTYTGGWYVHPTKLIKSYLNATKTPSTFNWVADGTNGSSYWEEDAAGNCHFSNGDEALCVLGNVGAPIAIRSVVPPHTYGEAELFSAGGCSLGARVRVFYTCPAPAAATGPATVVAAGTNGHFTASPPLGSVEGGWANAMVYHYEMETEPDSGVYEMACEDCSGDVDIIMPNQPGVYRMRVRAEYTAGFPSRGYIELIVKVGTPEGLPSPWTGSTVGEGSAEYSYNASAEAFSIQTSATNYDLTADNFGFIHTELCGDGEIVVKVKSIDGPGYGGVVIRETNAPNARGAALFSNLTPILRWEHRDRPGGAKQVRAFNALFPSWLKIQRWGNWIFAYSSPDGVRFYYVNAVNIAMNSCVNLGFGAYSYIPGVDATVVFSNVSITGGVALRGGGGGNSGSGVQANAESQPMEPSLFPNPASDNLTIRFGALIEQPTSLRLRNNLGQLIEQSRLEVPAERTEWNVSGLNPGLYLMEITTEGQPPKVLRFMKK